MKCLMTILCLVLIASCSSTQNEDQALSKEVQEEFDWIQNADFQAPKEVKFDARRDKFSEAKNEGDLLAAESINRLSSSQLRIFSDSKDPISSLVGHCYQSNFKEAFRLFDSLYAKFKKNPAYWNQLGTCYLIKNELSN